MPPRLKPTASIETKIQFEATVDEICKLQLDREALTLDRDRLLASVMEDHNPQIEKISEQISAKLLMCEKYALTHRETLFGKLKSAASNLGIFGFRIGQPKLTLLNSKWKWKDVINALKTTGRLEFLRVKEEPDKDLLRKLDDTTLASIGLRIVQDEPFYIEPKREDPERMTA